MAGPVRTPYDGARALGAWAWDNRRLVQGRVRLAGGDADLTIGAAIECAYALLVEGYLRLGMDMLTAIEKVDASLGLANVEQGGVPLPTAADNDAALAELQRMMGGLK